MMAGRKVLGTIGAASLVGGFTGWWVADTFESGSVNSLRRFTSESFAERSYRKSEPKEWTSYKFATKPHE
jgi:hypothetical protein